MRLKRTHNRPAGEPIIALIDVVFFLLVFFMLVARLDASAPFEVAPPIAITGDDMPGGGVTVSISATGDMAVDGNAVGTDWQDRVQRAVADRGTDLIRLNAHRDVPLRHVMPVIAALEEAALGRVVVVVTPPGSDG